MVGNYEDVGIRARVANLSKFERGSRTIQNELNKIGSASTVAAKQTTTAAQTMQSQVAKMAAGIATSLAGIGFARFIGDLALTAARTETLGIVLQSVGKVAGYTTTELQMQEDAVKKLGITTQAARQGLTQMMQAQMDVNQATKLARVAQDAAVIANMNSSDTMSLLLHGIVTLQPEVLRTAGIIVNLEQAYAKWAKTQGVTAESLTGTQKQTIALNEVLKAGERILGTYEAAMSTAGKQWTSLPRYIEEAKNALGEAFLPAMFDAIKGITALLKAVAELPEGAKKASAGILVLSAGVLTLGPTIAGIVMAIKSWAAASALQTIAQTTNTAARTASIVPIITQTGALQTQNAVLAQNNVLWIASSSGAIRGAIAIGQGVGSIAGPATVAATGVSGLTVALGALAAIGAVAGYAVLARQLANIGTGAKAAKGDVYGLTQELKNLQSAKEAMGEWFLEIPGIKQLAENFTTVGRNAARAAEIERDILASSRFVEDAFGDQAAAANGIIKPLIDVDKALENLVKLQGEYSAQARKAYPEAVAGFQKAIEALPEMAPELQAAFSDLLTRGPEALAKSAMKALTDAEQEAVNAALPKIMSDLERIAGEGLGDLSAEAQRRLELIRGPLQRAFEISPKIDLEGMVSAELQRKQTEQSAAVKTLETNLKAVDRQIDENSLSQLYLSQSMASANRELESQQALVRSLESALQKAQTRLQTWAQAPLIGMKAMEDALFDLGMAAANVRIQMLGIQAAFAPQIAAATKQTLLLRLAMLEAGDEAESMASKGSAAMFDMLAAQKRELETGIPVFLQFYEQVAEGQQQAVSTARQETEQQKALREAEKQLQILEIRQQLALLDLQIESDLLAREEERVNLQKKLTFDPQIKQIREAVEITKAWTLEEIIAGIQEAQSDIVILNTKLADANRILEDRQAVVDALKSIQDGLVTSATNLKIKQAEYNMELADTKARYDEITASLQSALDLLKQPAELAITIPESLGDEIRRRFSEALTPETLQQEIARRFSGNYTYPGMQAGGTVTKGGMAMVGEHGPEPAFLPTGTTVLPHSAMPASVNRSYSDVWNITQARDTVDVMNEVRKFNAFRRILGGR